MTERFRRNFDACRAARLRCKRIHGERVLRVDRVVARTKESVRDELQYIVAAIAEYDRLGRYRELRGQRGLQCKRIAVGIACQFGRRSSNRSKRLRAGSARVLVRRELDDRRWIEIVFTR